MTAIFVQEHGTYIGFCKSNGYIYKVANTFYSYNKTGLNKVSESQLNLI